MNLLLQILDEGHVKDAQGRSINFENTIICMTSNAGSSDKTTGLGFNKTEGDISREKAMKALSEFLRPEFLGRVDEIVVFDPLSKESYAEIAGLMLTEMKDPLSERALSLNMTSVFRLPLPKRHMARSLVQEISEALSAPRSRIR